MNTKRLTPKQKREQRETMIEAIRCDARSQARLMVHFSEAEEHAEADPIVTATARVVSLLIGLREWSIVEPLDDVMIQSAIDGWMEAAEVEGRPAPMGGETFHRIK